MPPTLFSFCFLALWTLLIWQLARRSERSRQSLVQAPVPSASGNPAAAPLPEPQRAEIGSIAHDFNNILTSVLGNVSLALSSRGLNSQLAERLLETKKAALRAQSLNEKLQALAGPPGELAQGRPAEFPPEFPPEFPAEGMEENATCAESTPLPWSGPAIHPFPGSLHGRKAPRILLLDDDLPLRQVITSTLEEMGYEVAQTGDGAKAVALYQRAFLEGRRFDLVISDLHLRSGISGPQTVERMRLIDSRLKALAFSGDSNHAVLSRLRESGFCGVLSKPCPIDTLPEVIARALAAQEGEPQIAHHFVA